MQKNIKQLAVSPVPRCPECAREIQNQFNFCPNCRADLRIAKIPRTLQGIGEFLADPAILNLTQMDAVIGIFKEAKDLELAHLTEEKIYLKFIRSISAGEYNSSEASLVAKKILILQRIPFARNY